MTMRTNRWTPAVIPVPVFTQWPVQSLTGFSNHEVEIPLCFEVEETGVICSVPLIPQQRGLRPREEM